MSMGFGGAASRQQNRKGKVSQFISLAFCV